MNRKGMALGFAFAVVIVLFLGGLVVSNLSRGIQRQLEYSDASIRAQYIAESGTNALVSRLLSDYWENRWFRLGPDSGAEIELGGGTYDYFIQDTPNRLFQADVWVRSSYRGVHRAYFWRVKFSRNLFEGFASGMVDSVIELPPEKHPESMAAANTLSQEMDQRMSQRAANQPKSQAIANSLQTTGVARDALSSIGAPSPAGVLNDIPAGENQSVPPPADPAPVTENWSQPGSQFDPPGDTPQYVQDETPPAAVKPPLPRRPPTIPTMTTTSSSSRGHPHPHSGGTGGHPHPHRF